MGAKRKFLRKFRLLGPGGDSSRSLSGKKKKNKTDDDDVDMPARPDGPLIEDTFSNVRDKYDILDDDELGSGQYGIVHRCTDRQSGEVLAVKTILKSRVSQPGTLRKEVKLLREVHHPNIIRLVDVFEDEENVHLVTELATGGELFDRIAARRRDTPEGKFTEREAAGMIRQILDALTYCHDDKSIVHRDLKPENFLFEGSAIKIIDFGYATRHSKKDKPLREEVGTPLYMAPEVMNHKYDRACDVWSVGVIAYTLLAGYAPFNGTSEAEIYELVKEGKFRFSSPHWDDVSTSAKDFVCKVLKKDPKLRITAKDARQHRWILENAPPERKVGRRRSSMAKMGRQVSRRLTSRFSTKNFGK